MSEDIVTVRYRTLQYLLLVRTIAEDLTFVIKVTVRCRTYVRVPVWENILVSSLLFVRTYVPYNTECRTGPCEKNQKEKISHFIPPV